MSQRHILLIDDEDDIGEVAGLYVDHEVASITGPHADRGEPLTPAPLEAVKEQPMMEGTTQISQEMVPRGVKPRRKTPTAIPGLDDVTEGGLPGGRSTLACGPAGCGKTRS